MTFETDLKKLQKLWDLGQANEFNLNFTQLKLVKYYQNITELPSKLTTITNLVDKGGTLQPIQLLLNQSPLGNQISPTQVFGAEIDVIINNFPEQWIPFVRFNIGMDNIQVLGTLTWFTEFEPTSADGTIGKATWHLGYYVTESIPDFQFKMYLTFVNPNLLV